MNMQRAVKRSPLRKGDGSLIRRMGQDSIHRSSLAGDSTGESGVIYQASAGALPGDAGVHDGY